MPKKVCSICQLPYEEFGNNAWPVNEGHCCDDCDDKIVIPARIRMDERRRVVADRILPLKKEPQR